MAPIDYSIKDIEKAVKLDGKVKNVDISRLTGPGENYLSLVLKVDFEVEKNGRSQTISTVAKTLPLGQQNIHFHGSAMKSELRWYAEIVPLMQDFAEANNIEVDFFPKCFGSRYSLNSSKKDPDSDAFLLLENLIPQGFQNDDRYIGFDSITTKAILRSLALFHALPVAMNVKEPEKFQILKEFLKKSMPDLPPGPDGKKHFGPPPGAKRPEEALFDVLCTIPDFAPYLTRIKPLLNKPMGPGSFGKPTKEPWNTIAHNDFWVNNIMVHHRDGKEPLVKIVDFQMCMYGSFAKDLVFFLLTSVRNDVLKDSLDDLLRFYYDEFMSVLRKMNVNLDVTYNDYLEEIRQIAVGGELNHALSFSTIIFGEKGTGVDATVVDFDPMENMADMLSKINQHQIDKLIAMASEAIKMKWC